MIELLDLQPTGSHDVIGVDPGDKSPAFFYLSAAGACKFSQSPIPPLDEVPVFCEGQFARPKSAREALMTLSFYAGLQAGYYLAKGCSVFILKPEEWRNALIPRSGKMPKTVFHNRCKAKGLIPPEVWIQNADVRDSYLIALAGQKLWVKGDLPRR